MSLYWPAGQSWQPEPARRVPVPQAGVGLGVGQSASPHKRESDNVPQAAPLPAAATTTLRARVCDAMVLKPPHVTGHVPHPPQSVRAQSTLLLLLSPLSPPPSPPPGNPLPASPLPAPPPNWAARKSSSNAPRSNANAQDTRHSHRRRRMKQSTPEPKWAQLVTSWYPFAGASSSTWPLALLRRKPKGILRIELYRSYLGGSAPVY